MNNLFSIMIGLAFFAGVCQFLVDYSRSLTRGEPKAR